MLVFWKRFQSLNALRSALATAFMATLFATPAYAEGSSAVPEANTITLISLAMAGVLIGRRMAKRRPEED